MRYLSVCSGIEAATVAWHPLGWEPLAFSEIDTFPCAVRWAIQWRCPSSRGWVNVSSSLMQGSSTIWRTPHDAYSHDIGWNQLACVTTTDALSTAADNGSYMSYETKHCLSGQELAKWMQEHHR